VLLQLRELHRARPRPAGDGIQIDFPKKIGRRQARARVVEDLDRIEPDWRRLFAVYPSESSLRGEPR
jgi:hypothetical protein